MCVVTTVVVTRLALGLGPVVDVKLEPVKARLAYQ